VVSNAGPALQVGGPAGPGRARVPLRHGGELLRAIGSGACFRAAPGEASRGHPVVQSLAALVISRSSPIYSASKAAAMMLAAGVRPSCGRTASP
jgi:hypothetical protein